VVKKIVIDVELTLLASDAYFRVRYHM